MLTFAIDAKCAEKLELEVRWPSGRVRKFSDVKPGFAYDVTEAGALKARRGYYPKREPPRASAQIPEWIRGIELGDKPTLVTLWASWCAACKNHVPRLNQLDGDGRLDVVAASIEPRDSETVTAAYREASSVDYKLLPYREQLAQGLIDEFGGLPPLPSSMLVTASGGITWIGTGLPSQSDIERALAASKPSKRNKRSPIIYFGAAAGGLALLLFIVAALRRRRSEPRDR